MKELFSESGCLTDDALKALVQDEPLDELERLEIAEHLSFCDACVARYTVLLDDVLLLAPEQPLAPGVLERLKQRARRLFVNKYATVVAAASFAIVFWNIGVFSVDLNGHDGKVLNALTSGAYSFSQKTTEFSDNITETLNKIFNSFTYERGTADHEKK